MSPYSATLELRALARWLEMAGAPSPLATLSVTSNPQATPTINVAVAKDPFLAWFTIPIDSPMASMSDLCDMARQEWERIRAGRKTINTTHGPMLWADVEEHDRTLSSALEGAI
jgi:hypothetical protein